MENQHRKITGYRELSQEEIDLMNSIKSEGELLGRLINNLQAIHATEAHKLQVAHMSLADALAIPTHMEAVKSCADAQRWTSIGRDHLQQGIMALVRAVARPTSF